MKAKNGKAKKRVSLGPNTEFAMNLLLIKHSGLRCELDKIKKFQVRDGSLTTDVTDVVTNYFKTIYSRRGKADGADVAAAVLDDTCFQQMLVQTWKNRKTLVKVQNFLNKTDCYDPMDPTHPSHGQAYFIFSRLSGVE